MESELVLDGVLAQDATQTQNLWALREGITEACSKTGSTYKYDLSTAPSVMYTLVEQMRERLVNEKMLNLDNYNGQVQTVVGFGHMGDGNLHLNIVGKKEYSETVKNVIEPFVYEIVGEYFGFFAFALLRLFTFSPLSLLSSIPSQTYLHTLS